MTRSRWPAQAPPEELGAVVHGPVVLARSPGIAAGLRCVFAHPTGLHLPVVVRAEGVQAEAAGRRTFPGARGREVLEPAPWSGLQLSVQVDGESRTVDAAGQESSGSIDRFSAEAVYWVGALPTDGQLGISVGWPQAGLAEATTVLALEGLDDLATRVLSL